MPRTFVTTRRVEFYETDMAGIVHFANFYRYMEQAEHELFRSLGLKIMEKQPDASIVGWPRVAASCSFDGPAHYGDVIEIRINLLRRGIKSLTMRYEFWRGEQRLAHGEMRTVCCHLIEGEPMRAIEIPPETIAKLREFEPAAANEGAAS